VHRILFTVVGAALGAVVARSRHRELRAERLAAATLETLLNAIDANDAVTGAHVRRVAAYSLILAQAVDAPEHERRRIERVALFHDVGKLHGALFDIIHDHRKLDGAERRAIATHPRRGAEVLEPLAAFYPELPLGVICHHERWDGSGYPRRLRGHAIPFTSRVVAIADTFDAVSASRRYHRGEGAQRAFDVIKEGRGTQFDPDLADRFLSPDVSGRIRDVMRTARRRVPAAERRNRRHAVGAAAPDVSFRWRDGLER